MVLTFTIYKFGARVAFLRQLERFASDKNYDKNTRFNIGELSGRYFKKTIKHYLTRQVRTSFLNITADARFGNQEQNKLTLHIVVAIGRGRLKLHLE